MKKLLSTVDIWFDKLCTVLMSVGCVVMTVTVLVGAACRYVLHINFAQAEEITMIGAMYLYFFGMIYAQRRDDEICADMVSLFTRNEKIIAFARILKHGISLAVCLLGTTWVWTFISDTAKHNPKFSVTKWPQMIYRLPMLICFVCMSIYLLKHLIDAISNYRKLKTGEDTAV